MKSVVATFKSRDFLRITKTLITSIIDQLPPEKHAKNRTLKRKHRMRFELSIKRLYRSWTCNRLSCQFDRSGQRRRFIIRTARLPRSPPGPWAV